MGFIPEEPSSSTPLTTSTPSDSTTNQPPSNGQFFAPGQPYPPHMHGSHLTPPTGSVSSGIVLPVETGEEFPFFSPVPIPGLYMLPPREPPSGDQTLLGYETCAAPTGCFNCQTLSPLGWVFSATAFMICWPLTCVPCLISKFHERFQRPVFGYPQAPTGYHVTSATQAPAPNAPPARDNIGASENAQPTKVVII